MIWMFPKIGVPQNGWFIMENPISKWMIWGKTHYFRKHPNVDSHILYFLFLVQAHTLCNCKEFGRIQLKQPTVGWSSWISKFIGWSWHPASLLLRNENDIRHVQNVSVFGSVRTQVALKFHECFLEMSVTLFQILTVIPQFHKSIPPFSQGRN